MYLVIVEVKVKLTKNRKAAANRIIITIIKKIKVLISI